MTERGERPGDADEEQRRRLAERRLGGLCPRCGHARVVANERGSVFLLCRLAATDARFPRYPPQPVLSCSGRTG